MKVVVVETSQYDATVRLAIQSKSKETIIVKTQGKLRSVIHAGKVLGSGGVGDMMIDVQVSTDDPCDQSLNLEQHNIHRAALRFGKHKEWWGGPEPGAPLAANLHKLRK